MDTRLYRFQRLLRLHQPAFKNREPLILRDHLAMERTRLANERTLLSYIRSSLYLLVGGVALVQVEGFGNLHYAGYLALVLCLLFLAVGLFRFLRLRDQLDQYYAMERWSKQRKSGAAGPVGGGT
ncbi:MAG: DUF202 domain-containing protein [Flavobacteriales bacterium]|nr:DUF202 domain-containing protein [Flavobacteriales bacterium]MBP9080654.1 DUF202 domain-containing protein [Flavobacteriales bacterium]